jgi:hypothetical protein
MVPHGPKQQMALHGPEGGLGPDQLHIRFP